MRLGRRFKRSLDTVADGIASRDLSPEQTFEKLADGFIWLVDGTDNQTEYDLGQETAETLKRLASKWEKIR